LGRLEEATEHFEYASQAAAATAEANQQISRLSDEPSNIELRYEIGAAHLNFGNTEDGLMWLMSVLELDPNHQASHRQLADYYQRKVVSEPKFIAALQRHRALAGPTPAEDVPDDIAPVEAGAAEASEPAESSAAASPE
jgi:tetratricopeptide (TPR) repeat protein